MSLFLATDYSRLGEHFFSLFFCWAAECEAGYFSYNGFEPCRACPRGYYQDTVSQTDCLSCGDDESTADVASISASNCISSKSTPVLNQLLVYV